MTQVNTKHKDEYYIKGINEGNSKVIQELYLAFMPRITRFIEQNNGNKQEAMDIFQEALVIIYNKVRSNDFRLTSSFYTFLYAICRNLWRNQLKKKKSIGVTTLAPELLSEESGVVEAMENYAKKQLFREKFHLLKESCQSILRLFFEGISMREIAEKLNISEKYARKRKFDCKEKLIEKIQADPKFKELNS